MGAELGSWPGDEGGMRWDLRLPESKTVGQGEVSEVDRAGVRIALARFGEPEVKNSAGGPGGITMSFACKARSSPVRRRHLKAR